MQDEPVKWRIKEREKIESFWIFKTLYIFGVWLWYFITIKLE